MPKYYLDNANPTKLMNWKIAKDVLLHLEQIIDQCSLRKLDKRSGVNQAVYAVAKRFGHVSSNPDLYLWHPTLGWNEQFFQGDQCIAVPDVEGATLCYRIWLLGKQSKNASGKLQQSADPNEVCIYVSTNRSVRQVNVTMDLSGPAMVQLCSDLGRSRLLGKIKDLLRAKWGCEGVRFDNIDPSVRAATGFALNREDRMKLGPVKANGEAYIYRRHLNGIPTNWDDGMGWIV